MITIAPCRRPLHRLCGGRRRGVGGTVAHGNALLQMGCEMAQGYGIARPMPPEQLPTWAAKCQPDEKWSTVVKAVVVT